MQGNIGMITMRTLWLCLGLMFLVQFAFAQDGEQYKMTINNGSSFTNDPEGRVDLQVAYPKNVKEMMLSTKPSFKDGTWQVARNTFKWVFEGEKGFKVLFVKFRLTDGSETRPVEAKIQWDVTPPTDCSIVIDGGKTVTNSLRGTVTLEVSATEAEKMQISNTREFKATDPWEPYKRDSKTWVLPNSDGKKTVYAQFKDLAGNISEPVSAEIMLDRTPPEQTKVLLDNGAEFTNKYRVALNMNAVGASKMFISTLSEWVPYQETYEIELPEVDGRAYVEVQFMDDAGNRSNKISDDIWVDTKPPEDCRVVVDNGNRYAKSPVANINVSAIGATEMMLSNDASFAGATWRKYEIVIPNWVFTPEGDGQKMVYVKFKDKAGNATQSHLGVIMVDNTPPSNITMKVEGNSSTNRMDGTVDLIMKAEDAHYMMLCNDESFQGSRWEVYSEIKKNWSLGRNDEDGEKKVYAKFRDKAGNVSEVYSAGIKLDRTGPMDCKIEIVGAPKLVKNVNIELSLFARSATQMMISDNASFKDASWVPYATTYKWQLEDLEGERFIYAKFKDATENESIIKDDKGKIKSNYISTSVILDQQPPRECSVDINKSDTITNDPDKKVVLRVRSKDAKYMIISNREDFQGARWDGYNDKNITWKLEGEDGRKRVYVKFKDEAGNETEAYNASIELDRKPPSQGKVTIVTPEGTGNAISKFQTVKLQLSADGANEMQISNSYSFKDAKWLPYKTETEHTLIDDDGLKTVFVRFKDKVGNVSAIAYDKIGLDRSAPRNGYVEINDKAKYCTDINAYVTLKLYAKDAKEMMIANNKDFTDAEWQKYELFVYRWSLEGEDGPKTIYAKFRDDAQNETPPVNASIILDRQEPINVDVNINDKAVCTNSPNNRVRLKIQAQGAKEMMISNQKFFNPSLRWEPFSGTNNDDAIPVMLKEWRLEGQNGIKTVYIKFRDESGNESTITSASILLDTQAPVSGTVKINNGKTMTNDSKVLLSFTAKGADRMWISNDPKFVEGEWLPFDSVKEWSLIYGVGRRSVYVKFKDDCGNEVQSINASITVAYE